MRTNADSRAYLHAAATFAQGRDDPAFNQWPPLLPLILATGISPRLLNALCYTVLVYLTLANVERYRVALAIAMLTPLMFYSFIFVLADGLFVLLTVGVLLELPRRRILPLALLLLACVLTKYAGLFLLLFAAAWLIGHKRYKNAVFAVFPALTAFLGWYVRCTALYGSLTVTEPLARYTPAENVGGAVATMVQFGGVILGCVLLSELWRRLRLRTRRLSFSPASPARWTFPTGACLRPYFRCWCCGQGWAGLAGRRKS